MLSHKLFKASAVLTLVVIAGAYSVNYMKRVADAYIFAYPLVIMDITRQVMEAEWREEPRRKNNFNHIQRFPDHTFKNVVRPNNDTLYSIAWLDLSEGPLVLSVPDTGGRHYVIPLMDAWSNVFTSVGKRTTGTQAGTYLINGPDTSVATPTGMTPIISPTNMVWIIGRIQTNGESDIPAVAALQTDFTLTTFNDWQQGQITQGYGEVTGTSGDQKDPYSQLENMSPNDFFYLFSELIKEQPASDQDTVALENLASIGGKAGVTFDVNQLSLMQRLLAEQAISMTHQKIKQTLNDKSRLENGWSVQRDSIGNYGTDYITRAVVAMIGLGALPPAEASYPNTLMDNQQRPLSGEHNYRIHFAANALPPVDAFWSLSMYDEDGFFIANPIDRYAIGDRDALQYNDDGSLDLWVQNAPPTAGTANWLPAPSGHFALTMRLYLPKEHYLNGGWQLPDVTRL
jgi:hypothetical protein